MMTVQFYQNTHSYPDFKRSLSSVTGQISCTPNGLSTTGGQLHIKGDWGTVSQYNYMAIRRDGRLTWAWVTNMTERGEQSVIIDYKTDAWRTYQSNITLGTQFVQRQPQQTNLFDELLQSDTQYFTREVSEQQFSNSPNRVLVVQVRRRNSADLPSTTPVQPTPYKYYFINYNRDNWTSSGPITELLNAMLTSGETSNIVSIYTVPFMDISGFPTKALPVIVGGETIDTIAGFRTLNLVLGSTQNPEFVKDSLTRETSVVWPVVLNELYRVEHDVKILIPGAGIMQVSDEALSSGVVRIRQDVDMFSGASNYMLVDSDGHPFGESVRGSSVSSIPILSDPYDTYISQNQNALTTAMIGDVASIGLGVGSMALGNPLGSTGIASGVSGLFSRQQSHADMRNAIPSNPPAMLGTALANHFDNTFYVIVTYNEAVNKTEVNNTFGFPVGRVKALAFPSTGFIQTRNCSVRGDGTVPAWALSEINQLFDGGIRVVA